MLKKKQKLRLRIKRVVFLDRDGVINVDEGYTYKTEGLRFYPDVFEALDLLKDEYMFFIVTNQSGINLGYYSYEEFEKFNNTIVNVLRKKGIEIKKTYCCPHKRDENCDCRKPSPKFALEAKEEFDLDLSKSYMIGDHPSDVGFGKNAGCKTIYLITGHGRKHIDDIKDKPDFLADSLLSAAKWIVNRSVS